MYTDCVQDVVDSTGSRTLQARPEFVARSVECSIIK